MEQDENEKKRELIQWLNSTFKSPAKQLVVQQAISIINDTDNTWSVILKYKREDWNIWIPFGMGAQIYDHLHTERPYPLVKRLSDPEYIDQLRREHGYLPRLHGMGGSIITESYLGEGNTTQFEGIKFTDTEFVYSDRKETLIKIMNRLDASNAILVRSPPMAGKTALSQLLERFLLESYPQRQFRVFRCSMLWMHVEGWDFKDQFKKLYCVSWADFLEECRKIETYLICDEIQMLYCPTLNSVPNHGGKSFWDQFKLACQGGYLKIIAFATYGYRTASHLTPSSTINISPFKLQKDSILSLDDILFSEYEFDDFVEKYCKNLLRVEVKDIPVLQVLLQNLTNRHTGITSFCLRQLLLRFSQRFKRGGTLTISNIFEYFHSVEFLTLLLENMRAYTQTSQLTEYELSLCDNVLFSSDDRGLKLSTSSNFSTTTTKLLSINTLVEKDGFIGFSAPIIRSLYIVDRFGFVRTATVPPISFKDFLIRTISSMSPLTFRTSVGGGKDGRLYESTNQMEFYRAASQVLPPNICIFPDAGAVYSTRGFVDFHIGIGGGWVVEFLRDGNKREDHMKRFMRNDKYYPIVLEVAEWVVIDVRGPLCSVADVIVDNLMVVNINADYTSASIRFGKEDLGNILFLG